MTVYDWDKEDVFADSSTSPDRMADLLREVADSGVAFEDPRIRYVDVQIDGDTWDEIRALAENA